MKAYGLAIVPVLASSLLLACGSKETGGTGGSGNAGTSAAKVNEQAAKDVTVKLVTAVTKAQTGSDGPGAAYSIAAAGQAAQGIVTPGSYGAGTPQAFNGDGIGFAQQADTSGTADCTATGCTFTGYADTATGTAWTIDGTLGWGGGHFTCDLTMTGAVQGMSWTFHEVCDLTVTATSIDGTLSTDGSYDAAGGYGGYGKVTWDSTVTFNDVVYSAAGCPQSGGVDVDASVSISGYSGSGTGTVTFDGTGC